jgi:ribosomal protein S18 acetylase RimI-like enzyme
MFKVTQVYPHYINEPAMKFGNWVKIEFDQDSEADVIGHLPEIYPQALLLAQNQNLHKIEIEFPSLWTDLPQQLQKLNFLPALSSFLLRPVPATVIPPSPNISTENPTVDALIPLLNQQADYHSQLYPQYYKPSTDIDWEYYRQYLEFDFKSPDTIPLSYLDSDHQIIGFLYGGLTDSQMTIWETIVDAKHRSQGIGRQLLSQFIFLCAQRSITDIKVETGWNQLASGLYLKSGFTHHTDTWYQNL